MTTRPFAKSSRCTRAPARSGARGARRVHRRPRMVTPARHRSASARAASMRCTLSRSSRVLGLAGCGGGSGGRRRSRSAGARSTGSTTHIDGTPAAQQADARSPTRSSSRTARTLTKFKRGAGPHTGVHVIFVRGDLGAIVHHHPPIAAERHVHRHGRRSRSPARTASSSTSTRSSRRRSRTSSSSRALHVAGAYTPQPLPPPPRPQTVDGYRFTLHGAPHLRAIEPAFLSFTVTRPNGAPAHVHAVVRRARARDLLPQGIARLLPHARVRARRARAARACSAARR